MIYLDAAATTLQKPTAVASASAYAVNHMATPGRGGHQPAMLAAETAFACRQAAAELDFETAAKLRDQLFALTGQTQENKIAPGMPGSRRKARGRTRK